MANPSPKAIAAIRDFVTGLPGGWPGTSDVEVVAEANDPAYENPAGQSKVPRPYAPADLLGLLSPGSAGNVLSFAGVSAFLDDILAQASARVSVTIMLLQFGSMITASEAQAMRAVLEATEPDPAWEPRIGWAQRDLGRPLDLDDAAASRPGKASP